MMAIFGCRFSKMRELARYLNETQLAHTFSLERQLKNVHAIFDRVFGLAS